MREGAMNKILTEYDVRLIRRVVQKRNRVMRELSNKSIARRLNVSVGTIRNVVKGARWGWVK
jgi:DNA-binding CsgD family transcriptional regulator